MRIANRKESPIIGLAGMGGGFASYILYGGSGSSVYEISRSLRFNSDDTAYLSRTPASAGNRKTWTWSGWVKRSGSYPNIFTVDGTTTTNFFQFLFEVNDQLYVRTANNANNLITSAAFRDFSAWYHLVLAVDTTQATASNRMKLYVNGSQITDFSTESYPTQNADLNVNTTNAHYIGRAKYSTNPFLYSDCYLADVHFIDGQALAPTNFGEFDSNGVWQPKRYSGTYGWFDDSQTWSNGLVSSTGSFFPGEEAVKLFDGDVSIYANPSSGNGSSLTFTPPSTLSFTSSVEIYTGGSGTHSFNGGTATSHSPFTWTTIASGSGTISSIVVTGTNYPAWSAIRVDNKILVNSGVSVADNSFHLDFSDNSSNAALGYDAVGSNDWTVNNITASAEYYVERTTASTYAGGAATFGNSKDNIFDGSNSTGTFLNTSNAYIQFEPQTPIAFTTSVEVYTGSNGDQCQVDLGSGYGTATAVPINTWTSVATGPGTLYGLRHGDSLAAPQLNAIRIDGTILSGNTPASDIDSLVGTPMNYGDDTGAGGEVRGNYATLNPLEYYGGTTTFTNGNLEVAITSAGSGGPYPAVRPTINPFNQGNSKLYAEVTIGSKTSQYQSVGANTQAHNMTGSGDIFVIWRSDGVLTESGVLATRTGTGVSYATDDVIGIAYDNSTQSLYFYKNGSLVVTWVFTSIPDNFNIYTGTDSSTGTGNFTWNFGQRPFVYAAPSGYKALCTTNQPEPTIADGSTAMDATLWTGDGSSNRVITSSLNHDPDLVWVKVRSNAYEHAWFDALRSTNMISSSNTATEGAFGGTTPVGGYVTNAGSGTGGFTVTPGTTNATYVNATGSTYVAWTWDAGTSNTSISAGDLTSSVYNQDQDYYATGTQSGSWSGSYDWEGVFISKDVSSLTAAESMATGGTTKFVFGTPISASTSVTIISLRQASGVYKINAGETDEASVSLSTNSSVEETTIAFSGSVKNIQIESSGNYIYVTGIKIDGRLLVKPTGTVDTVPSIASTVRANPSAGFSIVSWSTSGANTVGHGLNAAPELIILKTRQTTNSWNIYHSALGTDQYLAFSTAAAGTSSGIWGGTNSSVIGIGAANNGSFGNAIAYCFAPVEGYSAMGSYTGNGLADGPFVYTGFKPAVILLKNSTDGSTSWTIHDNKRLGYNPENDLLFPDTTDVENVTSYLDILSNGFKLRIVSSFANASNKTFVYAAFAEHPFKTARAR